MSRPFKKINPVVKLVLATALTLFSLASHAEPTLTLKQGVFEKKFSRSELLKLPGLETLTIIHDPAYNRHEMQYKAVPLRSLFKGVAVSPDALVQFRCIDGFTGPLSNEQLFRGRAIPYLAIETTEQIWPPLKSGEKKTAGPFYLIWKTDENTPISSEEWPYQLTGFDVFPSLEKQYPHIAPAKSFTNDSPVQKGFKVFLQNCFSCHSLNLEGGAHVGPDLNMPFSPTEYWNQDYLMRFIRNPQSVRHWVNDGMHGFSKEQLADADVQNLFSYFKEMARRR